MSAIEITGFTLHAAISLIAAAFQYHTSPIVAAIEDFNSRHKALVRKYGCTVAFLLETCSDARLVIDRVESYVVHTDNQSVIAFIKSYTLSFNMIGIAVSMFPCKIKFNANLFPGSYHSAGGDLSSSPYKARRYSLER